MPIKKALSALSRLSRTRRIALAASPVILSALAAAGCGQLAQKERELVFRVEPGVAGWYGGLPQGVVESELPVGSADGSGRLHTWWWPAQDRHAPAVLYLHGARWNLTGQLFRIEQLHRFGFSVLAIDYRGFGKSQGAYPSEEAVYEDAQAAWRHLATLQPDAGKRLIYGHSLGGAVAVDLAARIAAGDGHDALPAAHGLVVESSFTTLADIARALSYSWLPVQWVLRQKFDSADKIARVGMPVLVVHGTGDKVVPPALSEKLYAAARGKKKLLLVEGGTHNNCMRLAADEYRDALREVFGMKPGRR